MSSTVKVEITYSPNPYEIGQVVDMDRDEARARVGEGRAVYAYDDEPDPTVRHDPPAPAEIAAPAKKTPRAAAKPAVPAEASEPAGEPS